MITRKAIVKWVPAVDGGRLNLPDMNRYATIAKFPDDGPDWPRSGGWSVVLEFDRTPLEQGNPSIGEVRFLVEEAPQLKLEKANSIQLYEGLKLVASVDLE